MCAKVIDVFLYKWNDVTGVEFTIWAIARFGYEGSVVRHLPEGINESHAFWASKKSDVFG
jgi:hypothetical protein